MMTHVEIADLFGVHSSAISAWIKRGAPMNRRIVRGRWRNLFDPVEVRAWRDEWIRTTDERAQHPNALTKHELAALFSVRWPTVANWIEQGAPQVTRGKRGSAPGGKKHLTLLDPDQIGEWRRRRSLRKCGRENCDREFHRGGGSRGARAQVYCSRKCRPSYKKPKSKLGEFLTCRVCGNLFQFTRSSSGGRGRFKFCSSLCARTAGRETTRRIQKAKRKLRAAERLKRVAECVSCGVTFRKLHGLQTHCKKACGRVRHYPRFDHTCSLCARPFTSIRRAQKFCSKSCAALDKATFVACAECGFALRRNAEGTAWKYCGSRCTELASSRARAAMKLRRQSSPAKSAERTAHKIEKLNGIPCPACGELFKRSGNRIVFCAWKCYRREHRRIQQAGLNFEALVRSVMDGEATRSEVRDLFLAFHEYATARRMIRPMIFGKEETTTNNQQQRKEKPR